MMSLSLHLAKFLVIYSAPSSIYSCSYITNRIDDYTATRLPTPFSNVKYKDIAAYVWLDPSAGGEDIRPLETFRSRIPKEVFRKICTDVDRATVQYGRMSFHDNEEARGRYITSVSSLHYVLVVDSDKESTVIL
jgi:hypothetical protein